MHSSHVQYKRYRSKCLQGIMHEIKIDKSELELY